MLAKGWCVTGLKREDDHELQVQEMFMKSLQQMMCTAVGSFQPLPSYSILLLPIMISKLKGYLKSCV